MKLTTVLWLAMVTTTTVRAGQEESAVPNRLPDSATPAESVSQSPVSGDDQTGAAVPDEETDDWVPRLVLTLHTKPGGRAVTIEKRVRSLRYQTAYQDVVRDGKTVRQVVQQPVWGERMVEIPELGSATLSCDAVTVNMSVEDNVPQHTFECPGRLRLRMGESVIDAESGVLNDGQLRLVNAKLSYLGTTATAAELNLRFPLYGLSTGAPAPAAAGSPYRSPLTPTPDPGFRTQAEQTRDSVELSPTEDSLPTF